MLDLYFWIVLLAKETVVMTVNNIAGQGLPVLFKTILPLVVLAWLR